MDKLKEFDEIARNISENVEDTKLSQWTKWAYEKQLPTLLQQLLPSNVGCVLLNVSQDIDAIPDHQKALDTLYSGPQQTTFVVGTLDAAKDVDYQHLYTTKGWRTVVYLGTMVLHRPVPGGAVYRGQSVLISYPVIFYSKDPDALDVKDFTNLCTASYLLMSAIILRLGMTWHANRAAKIFTTVANLTLIISSELIYECNDRCWEWFELPERTQFPLVLSDYLPPTIQSWIKRGIKLRGQAAESQDLDFFWLTTKDKVVRRVEVRLASYNPFENIDMRLGMSTGYDGVTADAVDRSIFTLTIKDISAQWQAQELEQELAMARKVQLKLQPAVFPKSALFEVAGSCQPANHVGGDLYDVVQLADGRLAVIVADAAGHGLQSALLAAVATGAFRAVVIGNPQVEFVLGSIDAALRTIAQTGFVTVAFLLFSADGRKVSCGLAGHHSPILWSKGTVHQWSTLPSSIPLGVNLPPHYHITEFELTGGDTIMIFSDGLVEAQNPEGLRFETKIPELITEIQDEPAGYMVAKIIETAASFRGGKPQEDDVTAVIVKIKQG